MEDIVLYLVVFVGWIIFKVFQAVVAYNRKAAQASAAQMKAPRRPAAGTTPRAPGLLVLEELKRALEEGVEELGDSVKHDLPSTPPDMFVSRTAPTPEVARAARMGIKPDRRAPPLIEDTWAYAQSAPTGAASSPFLLSNAPAIKGRTPVPVSVERLRQAVVWSEILARPVSMRDER